MNILIDAHMVGERETGNETYIVNLIRGLQEGDSPHAFFLASAHPEVLADQVEINDQYRLVPVSASPVRRLLIDLPAQARACCADVLHVTYMGPLRCPVPMVVSVHDVAYRAHPEWFSLRDRMVLRGGIRSTIYRARRVIAISQHAKREILRHYQLPDERVAVTHLAPGSLYGSPLDAYDVEAVLRRLDIQHPYILAAGNLQPRKNLTRLVDAFALLKKQTAFPHHLVLCGKAQWRESEVYDTIRRCAVESSVHFTGYVSETDLRALYHGADVFAYPSLYEGFGLPILEAMACGTPVVTSSKASMPEVAGDAALLVDPYDPVAISEALSAVLSDPDAHANLTKKGLQQAATFSWKQTARETLRTYEATRSDNQFL